MNEFGTSASGMSDSGASNPDGEAGMDLILWRHADAEDGTPDAARALTKRGHKQAERIGAWLKERLPQQCDIVVSPATRAQQTAEALGLAFRTEHSVGVGASTVDVLNAAGWPDGSKRTVVVVGHQPTLGRLAALLLAGAESDWTVKKGALWWLSSRVRTGETQVVLRAVIAPDLV